MVLTKYSYSYLKKLLSFQGDRHKNIVNLSRINSEMLLTTKPTEKYTNAYVVFRSSVVPAFCISFRLSMDDWTAEPRPAGKKEKGLMAKVFMMVPQTLEIERKIATICVLANIDSYSAQLCNSALSFSTHAGVFKSPSSESFNLPC